MDDLRIYEGSKRPSGVGENAVETVTAFLRKFDSHAGHFTDSTG